MMSFINELNENLDKAEKEIKIQLRANSDLKVVNL
jgi:hypothetical protein